MLDKSKILIDNFEYFDEVSSTNDVILEKVTKNNQKFYCAFAEKQTKGRGRFKRAWQTFPYKSMAFSFNLDFFAETAPLVLCCSMHKVLVKKYQSRVAIKWPNDIYCDGNKLSGILVESFPLKDAKRVYIVGIGLNVHSSNDSTEDGIGFLDQTTDVEIEREDLLNAIFEQIQQDMLLLKNQGFKQFKDYFMQNCLFLNEIINVNINEKIQTGEFLGINDDGYLILKQKEVILNITAGQIVQHK